MKSDKLDGMCQDCQHLNKGCQGSYSGFYSGCIWKAADPEDLEAFGKRLDKNSEGAGK